MVFAIHLKCDKRILLDEEAEAAIAQAIFENPKIILLDEEAELWKYYY